MRSVWTGLLVTGLLTLGAWEAGCDQSETPTPPSVRAEPARREHAARETGTLADTTGTHDVAVEPLTYYGVLRGMHSFNKGRQGLGVMNTTTLRSFSDANELERYVNRAGVVTAVDGWTFLDEKKNWVISGWAAATQVTGSADRIRALQRSSAHYFQRPDAGHIEVEIGRASGRERV